MVNNQKAIFKAISQRMLSGNKNGVSSVVNYMEDEPELNFLSEFEQKDFLNQVTKPSDGLVIRVTNPTTTPNNQLTLQQAVTQQQAVANQNQQQTTTNQPKSNNLIFWGLGAMALFFIFKK